MFCVFMFFFIVNDNVVVNIVCFIECCEVNCNFIFLMIMEKCDV